VISAYVSASQVTLDRGIPRGLTNATYVYGTNDATAIQAAATAAQAYFTANGLSAAVSLDGHFITNIAITSGINVSWVGYGWGRLVSTLSVTRPIRLLPAVARAQL
jgi:hypothetical protein